MASPSIVSTSPQQGETSVPTNTTISIIFNQEIDIYRLKNGGVLLEGPDESKVLGPGLLDIEPPETDEDDFLSSPGLKGIVDCDYAFSRVDGSGNSISYYDYGDTGQAGQLYRTKVTLTPKTPLKSLTDYTVYIIGDEDTSDSYDFGLSTRSVFDTVKGANLGNGEISFYGGYTGSVRQQFSVRITSAGAAGVAEYEWWTSTDSIHKTGTSSAGYRLLKEGVYIKFVEGLQFSVDDTFTVWCDVPVFMSGAYSFAFTTSSHAPTSLPVSSTTLDGSITSSASSSAFSVLSTNPEDRAALIDDDITSITVTFNSSINPSTVTSSTVTVEGEPADGLLVGGPTFTETLTNTFSVSSESLVITIDPDEVFQNNLIIVTLNSSVSNTDGTTLGSDYTFFFGTELTPFYAGIRQVKFRLGSIGNGFYNETIAFAIWEASREADAFAPPASMIVDTVAYNRARQQFVICLAAWILAGGSGSGIGDSVRKRLGDFDVSRSPSNSGNNLLDTLSDCVEHYRQITEAGGRDGALYKPVGVVKGDNNPDKPYFGRLWEKTTSTPIANTRFLYSGRRRWVKGNS